MARSEHYIRSDNWIKFRDEKQWRYAPPYRGPRNKLAPYRGVPPSHREDLSNRNYNKSRRAPMINMNSRTGDFSVMKYGYGKSLPGYKGPVYHNSLAKGLIHLGLKAARFSNPSSFVISTAFDVAMSMDWSNGWFKYEQGGVSPNSEYDFSNYEFLGVPGSWFISCFDDSLPWSIGFGTGATTWGNTPGGVCGSGYFNVNNLQFDEPPTDLAPHIFARATNSSGAKLWRLEAIEIGPANTPMDLPSSRHNMKMKTNATGFYNENVWPMPEPLPIPAIDVLPDKYRPMPVLQPPTPVSQEMWSGDMSPWRGSRRRAMPRYRRPAVTVVYNPGGPRRPTPRRGGHDLAPPPPRTREKKGQTFQSDAMKFVAALYDATTEAAEVVDILYDSLGKKCRGARSMSEKAYCIWRNIDTLDIDKAILELIRNHYEDKIYGRVFGTIGKHTKFGSMLPGTGPSRQIRLNRR